MVSKCVITGGILDYTLNFLWKSTGQFCNSRTPQKNWSEFLKKKTAPIYHLASNPSTPTPSTKVLAMRWAKSVEMPAVGWALQSATATTSSTTKRHSPGPSGRLILGPHGTGARCFIGTFREGNVHLIFLGDQWNQLYSFMYGLLWLRCKCYALYIYIYHDILCIRGNICVYIYIATMGPQNHEK